MTLRDKAPCFTRSATSSRKVLQKSAVGLISASSNNKVFSATVEKGQRVRRRLFGDVGCSDPRGWAANQLQLLEETESTTLGYDFKNDCPIVNGDLNEYIFEAVDERSVPSFYRAKTSSSFDRRERIGPPNGFSGAKEDSSPFAVIMQVHDSIAYNTRSHDIITFVNSCNVSENSTASLKPRLSNRISEVSQPSESVKEKNSISDQKLQLNRKRTMKQQTLPEFLPVVRSKRHSVLDKKHEGVKGHERKGFVDGRCFRVCKARIDSPDLVVSSGTTAEELKAKVCDFDNRRITRSMCA